MTPDLLPPEASENSANPTSSRIVSLLLRGARRREMQTAVSEGKLVRIASSDVLTPEGLPRLATQSVWLFAISAALYALLIGVARQWDHTGQLLGVGPVILRLGALAVVNIAGYLVMIPLHEAVHALVILALGGRPRFGLKLPLAAYCTAPNQLFLRDGYLTIALAPLVSLTALTVVIALLAPNVAAGLLLFMAGNVSGAVGDIEVARAVRLHPADTLIADTETGYIAYRRQ